MMKSPICLRICILIICALFIGVSIKWFPKIPLAQEKNSLIISVQSERHQQHMDALHPDAVPNIVYYIWCDRKIFEYKHYLSIKSAFKFIRPDRVVFYYVHQPRHDMFSYNRWYNDLFEEEPLLESVYLEGREQECSTTEGRLKIVKEMIQHGGILIDENIILLQFPIGLRTSNLYSSYENGYGGIVVVKQNYVHAIQLDKIIPASSNQTWLWNKCYLPVVYNSLKAKSSALCIKMEKSFYPKDTWNANTSFAEIVNMLMYNQRTVPKPQPSDEDLIPNIGHVIWIGGNEMDFLFYLCCLSLLYVVKVDTLYLHGDKEPTGSYWALVKKEKKVQFVHLPVPPNRIFNKEIKNMAHMSDIYRVEIMLKYGGVYSDTDAVWVQPIPSYLRRYDAVAVLDWPEMYRTFPDYINFGTALGRRGARFWKAFRNSMHTFRDDFFGYNGLLLPYKLYERDPSLLLLHDRLQVMCWRLRCHPTWVADFRNANSSHHTMEPPLKWNDSITFHWTYPTPDELTSMESLANSKGLFAEIGKHILRKAGIL